jgi:hypothetical protein
MDIGAACKWQFVVNGGNEKCRLFLFYSPGDERKAAGAITVCSKRNNNSLWKGFDYYKRKTAWKTQAVF